MEGVFGRSIHPHPDNAPSNVSISNYGKFFINAIFANFLTRKYQFEDISIFAVMIFGQMENLDICTLFPGKSVLGKIKRFLENIILLKIIECNKLH